MHLTCRFYKNQLPRVEDLVMVNVTQIEELGVYVNLFEYNNRQGMILLTELSPRRIRSIHKLVRVGRNEVVVVVRVDQEKGYIDLSKRRASSEEAARCEEKFFRSKIVNTILRQTAEKLELQTNDEFEELYEKTAWFYDQRDKKQGAAYDVFHRVMNNEKELDDCPIDENTRTILISNIHRHLATQAVKCRADVEVACFNYEGIDAVKAALRDGLKESTEEMPVKINLITPPLYVVTATCLDGNKGINALKKVMERIKESIEKYRGIFKVKMEPQVITDAHERALQEQLEQEELDKTQKPGDDTDGSEEEEENSIQGELDDHELSATFGITNGSRITSQMVIINNDDAEEEKE
ncbi:hypothetical protein I4U23_014800 [Adineta vaga]|nr:hypothetical protein I4U23_014800 [Adineta vaga]